MHTLEPMNPAHAHTLGLGTRKRPHVNVVQLSDIEGQLVILDVELVVIGNLLTQEGQCSVPN